MESSPLYVDNKCAAKITKNLSNFRRLNTFQTGIMELLTTLQMTETEVSELADLFNRIDTDGDGYLSPEELRNGLSEVCGALQL